MTDQLANQAAEQLKLYEKQKAQTERKLDASKHQQSTTLQEKLNARLKKKEDKSKQKAEQDEKNSLQKSGMIKVEPPVGNVSFACMIIKNIATLWDSLDEENVLKALEDVHDLVTKDLVSYNAFKVKEEIGKFLLASQSVEDLINLAMSIQKNFNENKWSEAIMKLPVCKRQIHRQQFSDIFDQLFRPEDNKTPNAKPLFNGPRIQIGIYSGDAYPKKDVSGQVSYSGITVIKTESVGNFAQGGQILLPSPTWANVNKSKLAVHSVTEPGTYKLDGFSAGCKIVEVLPISLKDRSKFFGSVCAHCNEVIKPNEQFFRALNCIWHMNHFRCFQCNADLGGSFVEHEGSPYCKNCYLMKNAPKCKNCNNPITAAYINALGGYWHTECFCCKHCQRRPSPEVQIYEYNELPYCKQCYQQVAA